MILYLIVNMSSYTLIINGDFYEKAQKNLRRFEKFYSNPRNASPERIPVSLATVRSWIFQGKLPVVKIGRMVFIRKEVLEKD